MYTITFLRDLPVQHSNPLPQCNLPAGSCTQKLYSISPPIEYTKYLTHESTHPGSSVTTTETHTTSFIVSSASTMYLTRPETLVFPSDREGKILSFSELAGVSDLNHEAAISDLLS